MRTHSISEQVRAETVLGLSCLFATFFPSQYHPYMLDGCTEGKPDRKIGDSLVAERAISIPISFHSARCGTLAIEQYLPERTVTL